MNTWIQTIVMAAMLGGCGDSPDPLGAESPGVAQAAEPRALQLEAGDVFTYDVHWTSDSEGRGPMALDGGQTLSGAMALDATLELRVHRSDERGALVGVELVDVERAELSMLGHDVLDVQELLGHEALLEVSTDGELGELRLPRTASPMARQLIVGLVSRLGLRRVDRADGRAVVASAQGLAEAEVRRDGRRVRHQLSVPARLDASWAGESSAPRVGGDVTIELGDDELPASIVGVDWVAVDDLGHEPLLRSRSSFGLERRGVERGQQLLPLPGEDAYARVDPFGPPDDEESRRLLAQRYADGITAFDVEMDVRAAVLGVRPPRGQVVRAVGRLRGWPETAQEMVELFDFVTERRGRSMIMDLLASAGTPQSQAVMRELLGREDVRFGPDFGVLVQRMAFIPDPEPETGRFLVETYARSRTEIEREAMAYPLGSVARSVESEEPLVAEAMVQVLREQLETASTRTSRIGALAGLGNAGRAVDLEQILAYTADDDAGVRGAAALALRHLTVPQAEERLIEMLADSEHYVADAAQRALRARPESAERAARLAAVGIEGAYHPSVAQDLASVVMEDGAPDEVVQAALMAMRDRATEDSTRRHLTRWLEARMDLVVIGETTPQLAPREPRR